ncbi:MAG: hypothetical protein HY663_05075 [Chloroflexi bacterium]|nr:hypothetical protein [Chloroflexota bacterium]
MKKRNLWLVVSCLMALSLVLAACAPKVVEKKEVAAEKKEVAAEKKEVAAEKKEVVTQKKEAPKVAVPKYGGGLNVAETADPPVGFDNDGQLTVTGKNRYPVDLTNEFLVEPDRTKGPLGTKEYKALQQASNAVPIRSEFMAGMLAESWQIIPPDTFKFKIRKGVHWQNKAPTNGAELTPDDVVYSFQLWWGRPGTPIPVSYPYLAYMGTPEEVAKAVYIDPDDPWTVVVKTKPNMMGPALERFVTDHIVPKALGPIEGKGFSTWRGVVGTGPFYLTDYVSGSSLTYERNPNYWGKDALHPENQLPYVGNVRISIIPDTSTRIAALRTGKLDILQSIVLDDAESLWKTDPRLPWDKLLTTGRKLSMRHDVAPFNNVNVRRAMMMAINPDEIIKEYYKGEAIKFYSPVYPILEQREIWIPLEEMPRSVQELYEYHPDKAKQILTQEGYPKGFTTSIILSSVDEESIDLTSMVASYWAKVGVTLNLDIKEPAVFAAMQRGRTYKDGTFGAPAAGTDLTKFLTYRVGGGFNYAMVNDPFIEKLAPKAVALYFDVPGLARLYKEEKVMEYIHGNALLISLPAPYLYTFWHPWVGGYWGEQNTNFFTRVGAAGKYAWIDQDLKKAMGK